MSNRARVKVRVQPKKAIKPKMGKGTGGAITAKLIAKVKKDKK